MEISNETTLQKNIEKIAQAIYLVSNHLKDTEPLKWELRKESLNFLTSIRSMGGVEGKELPSDLVIDTLTSCARDLTSYLLLASVGGLISRNNATLIINEIKQLVSTFVQVIDENTAKAGFVLSEDFFATDPELARHLNKKDHKGQSTTFVPESVKSLHQSNNSKGQSKGHLSGNDSLSLTSTIKDKKNERQAQIISLLKSKPNLTIKDFVKVIIDCSEKTIQRELIELMEKGIVKKEGERRWSTYSLK